MNEETIKVRRAAQRGPRLAKGIPESASLRRPMRPRPRCACGSCRSCVEDARWERIFNEKFADPNYYRLAPAHGSSLSSF